MFILMHIAKPIGKGTKAQCEAMIAKLRVGKESSPAFATHNFLILSMDEYEDMNRDVTLIDPEFDKVTTVERMALFSDLMRNGRMGGNTNG